MQTASTSTTEPDWPALIDAARLGDDEALGLIVRELHNYLLTVADQNLGAGVRPKFGASDIVQQSYMEARRSFTSFQGTSEGEIRAWLKKIVLHNLIDYARKYTDTQSRDTERETSVEATEPGWNGFLCEKSKTASWQMSKSETDLELMAAVQTLPARQRLVVEQRHRNGSSYQEIAVLLEITEGAARNLWTRAMQNLRDRLTSEDGLSKRRKPTRSPK